MALRLIELIVSEDIGKHVSRYLEDYDHQGIWYQDLNDGNVLVRVLIEAEEAERVLDLFNRNYGSLDEFRTVVLPVSATLPRIDSSTEETDEDVGGERHDESPARAERISRQELYTGISESAKLSKVYTAMILLSSIVAAIGVLRGNLAIIIGAMVIAPLLGPNVALAFAVTLGDFALARRASKTIAVGVGLAVLLATLVGAALNADPISPEIASRTVVSLGDVAIALAAGAAGALAFTGGLAGALVGVMVAVALLPPVVTLGLLLGSGCFQAAGGALLLFLVNLVCVNLAGITTFLVQGIRPFDRREADRAKRSATFAVGVWVTILAALVILIVVKQW
jgi:uncharacterized hydrophobic protein (TIGR00341 family)